MEQQKRILRSVGERLVKWSLILLLLSQHSELRAGTFTCAVGTKWTSKELEYIITGDDKRPKFTLIEALHLITKNFLFPFLFCPFKSKAKTACISCRMQLLWRSVKICAQLVCDYM